MKKAIVADTYKNFEQIGDIFQKNGKNYITVKQKCDRCWNGIFVSRVENNHPIPHPAYGGVCLKCDGKGYIEKDVRAYTEKEKASLDRAKERRAKAAEIKRQERAKEMEEKAYQFKCEAREKRGFNYETGIGYLAVGNTYPIKETLKEAGAKFNGEGIKGWVLSNDDKDFGEDISLIPIDFDKCYKMNGKFAYQLDKESVQAYILQTLNDYGCIDGEWVGEIGDRLRNMEVRLVGDVNKFDGIYGTTYVYTFRDADDNQFKWMTTKVLTGEFFTLTGTVKAHNIRNEVKETMLTRCIAKEK